MWHRKRNVDDFSAEIQAHIEMETERLMRLGMDEADARRAAHRTFGNTTGAAERFYERGRTVWIDHLAQDVRYVFRGFRRNPAWSATVLLVLALGIGVNTAIFSLAYNILFKPLPYPHPEQLVWMWGRFSGGDRASVSPPDFVDYRTQARLFQSMAAAAAASFNLTGTGEPERLTGSIVSADYFQTLGVMPQLGRDFRGEDEQVAQPAVVMLSNGLWQRRYGSDPEMVGRSIVIDDRPTVVAGVMPPSFSIDRSADVWLPLPLKNPGMVRRASHFLRLIGRLKPGVGIPQAQAELDVIAKALEREYPQTNSTFGIRLQSLHDRIVGGSQLTVSVLIVAGALVLFIACANVASLLLSRISSRQREIAVRSALGATRSRIVRLYLTESLVLSICGGGLGLLLAEPTVSLFIKATPVFIPNVQEIAVDHNALLFTAGVSIVTGLAFGTLPIFRALQPAGNGALKEGTRVHGSAGRSFAHEGLVVVEVALAVVLSIGAGLMIRSLYHLTRVDPGFETANLLTFRLDVSSAKYKTSEQRTGFLKELLRRIETVQGVQSAAIVSQLPLSGQNNDNFFEIEGRPPHDPAHRVTANFRMISESYFRTVGISLLRGRTFTPEDADARNRVTVVNQALVDRYFPNEDPIGHRLLVETGAKEPTSLEIVGVVDGIRHFGLRFEPWDEMYVITLDSSPANFVIRTSSDPLALASVIRREILAVDKDQPISNVRSMEEIIESSLGSGRVTTYVLSAFTLMALILATVGIYGLVAYSVAQRMHEIGLRIALGAQRRDIFAWVLRRGFRLGSIGVAIGLLAAFCLTWLMKGLLYEVSAVDPLTFVAIPLLLLAVTLLSSYFPARRGVKVDPMQALRCD